MIFITDTDSLTYEMKPKNVQEEFFNFFSFLIFFYFSNYSIDSKFFNEFFKDEFGGVIISEFIGLKSKMYSIKKIVGKEHNTAKGVSIATQFNKFKFVLFNKKIIRHKMKRIQSKKHKLGTYEIDKISLSCFDDEICLDDGIYTLSYFRKNCVKSCNN